MRKLVINTIIILCTSLTVSFATIQERDLLILEGSRHYTYSLPELSEVIQKAILPKFIMLHTANYNGYRASWAIIDNQLYLIGVEGKLKEDNGSKMHSSKQLFPSLKFPYKIKGYSGHIILTGRSGDYTYVNKEINEIKEIKIEIKNGYVHKMDTITINPDRISKNEATTLFNKFKNKKLFESKFEISKLRTTRGKTFGIYFDEKEWSANLKLKDDTKFPINVRCIFPIINEKLDVKIDYKKIIKGIKAIEDNPYINSRFYDKVAIGVRMRIAGDRLHWNTKKLQSLHEKANGKKVPNDELVNWVYIIIDEKPREYNSIYLNIETKELLKTD